VEDNMFQLGLFKNLLLSNEKEMWRGKMSGKMKCFPCVKEKVWKNKITPPPLEK
jgi:hypothetical protein